MIAAQFHKFMKKWVQWLRFTCKFYLSFTSNWAGPGSERTAPAARDPWSSRRVVKLLGQHGPGLTATGRDCPRRVLLVLVFAGV